MADPLFSRKELEDRYSPTTVQRVLDDFGEGSPSVDAIDQIRADASSKVRGKIGPSVNLDDLDPEVATEVKRIALDVAGALMAIRHPEVVRRDGIALMKLAEKDLEGIRLGQADLGTEDEQGDTTQYGVVVSDPRPRTSW